MNIFFSRHNYVRADKVMKLRHLLDKLGNIPGMMSEEKGQVNSISLIVNISYKSLCNTEITISIDCKENLINNLWCNLYSSIECCIAVNVPV